MPANQHSPHIRRTPYRPLARAQIVRALIFACQSRAAARRGGWIDNVGMNDILSEVGASSGTLDALRKVGLVERRHVPRPGGGRDVPEWRPGPEAEVWLKQQKDLNSL